MPTKNVYVSDSDLPLFERGAELAGSMSTAVAAGLRLYVAQRKKEQEGTRMGEVEIQVDDGPVVTTKRFTGRLVLRYELREGARVRSFRVYATARGQYAVHARSAPDRAALSGTGDDDPAGEGARTWSGAWWRSGERTLRVFPDVESTRGELPDEVTDALSRADREPATEDLDI